MARETSTNKSRHFFTRITPPNTETALDGSGACEGNTLTSYRNSFNGSSGGTQTRFSFTLAGTTTTANSTWHNAGPGSAAEREMKAAIGFRPSAIGKLKADG